MRIFLTGGTGLVGTLLIKRLRERGDHVVVLSRRLEAVQQLQGDNVSVVVGDPANAGPWMDAIADCQAVVHLAGEGLFNRRWNQAFKDLIYSSRIDSTKNVVAAISKIPNASARPVLVSGSAIGVYGPRGDEELTEASPHGSDYLSKLCLDWENAASTAAGQGVRVVLLRTGIVLDPAGGALKQMLPPFKMFVGGPIGSGKQYMSWIHNEDEVGLILFAIDHAEITGPLNATAPNPVTNKQFAQALGKVLGRPSFLPTPAFALRVLLGESAQIVANGQRVLPAKALAAGYRFKFTDIEAALQNLLV
jgi:uncharacterized protein